MKKFLVLALIFSLFLVGCKTNVSTNDNVKIENKLHKNIVCLLGYNYPDLSFNFVKKSPITDARFEIDGGTVKEIDTLGLCQKKCWDEHIKRGMLMVFVFDKDKLTPTAKLEDALLERYYYSYVQLMKVNGVIPIE